MTAETYFNEILNDIPDAVPGKMFGCPSAKMPNGKAGMFFKNNEIIVKISGETLEKALKLDGVGLFTPKENRPMNGWYVIPFQHHEKWMGFAKISCSEVAKLEKK